MKYCTHCGNQVDEMAEICTKCGCKIGETPIRESVNEESNPRFCTYCGNEVNPKAVVCLKCGRSLEPNDALVKPVQKDDTMDIIIKIFMIIGCVAQGWMLIPLAWCVPITVNVFKKIKNNEPMSTSLKVCSLIFVNLIAGICMLCVDDDK